MICTVSQTNDGCCTVLPMADAQASVSLTQLVSLKRDAPLAAWFFWHAAAAANMSWPFFGDASFACGDRHASRNQTPPRRHRRIGRIRRRRSPAHPERQICTCCMPSLQGKLMNPGFLKMLIRPFWGVTGVFPCPPNAAHETTFFFRKKGSGCFFSKKSIHFGFRCNAA